jgi:hypothetical protein
MCFFCTDYNIDTLFVAIRSPPAATAGNSATVTVSVSASTATRDEYDDQPVKSSSSKWMMVVETCVYVGICLHNIVVHVGAPSKM